MAENKKKGINTNSNVYTIVYSAVLVVIVAFMMAYVFQSLKPAQDANVALDKKTQLLASLNIYDLSGDEAAKKYAEVVLEDNIVDPSGKLVEQGKKGAEDVAFKLSSADAKAGRLAVFVCKVDGQTKYIMPVYGMGLWGAINGYVSVDGDGQTVYGVYFNHDSETAGLGAEIKDNRKWQQQFRGKKLFGTDGKIALSVHKKADVSDPTTQCEAVTGATLTSDGVSNMLQQSLSQYLEFLNSLNK